MLHPVPSLNIWVPLQVFLEDSSAPLPFWSLPITKQTPPCHLSGPLHTLSSQPPCPLVLRGCLTLPDLKRALYQESHNWGWGSGAAERKYLPQRRQYQDTSLPMRLPFNFMLKAVKLLLPYLNPCPIPEKNASFVFQFKRVLSKQ